MNLSACWRGAISILFLTANVSFSQIASPGGPVSDPVKPVAAPPPELVEPATDPFAKSIVKIFSTVRYPDPYKPWTKQAPTELTGSGVVMEGNRILTCAHVVAYAGQIQIQANETGDKVVATVESIAPGIDLAVLKLDDESFFSSHPPLQRARTLPDMRDSVMAYGYPTGGAGLSITKGIISRVEFAFYNPPVSGLRIQIDAAINPGNSGGPAVVGDKMIGLAYSLLSNSQNIGYIIPCEEIELFLKDIADGHYDGKPALFDDFQPLGNAALRSFLKVDKSVEGVVVHQPESTNADYPLKEWDVVTRIGDTPIDDQGTIKINDSVRAMFKYEVQKIAKDGKVPLTIVRGGKELDVEVPAPLHRERVLPSLDGGYPSYFVYGPIVFSSATTEFLGGLMRGYSGGSMMGILSATGSPLVKRMNDKVAFEGERLVVVSSPLFPHRLSRGYSNPAWEVVKTVNGIPIRNLDHLVAVLRDSKDEFIRIEPDCRGGETLVFRRSEILAATDEILTDNDIRTQGSPDTLAVWNAKPGRPPVADASQKQP